MPADRFQVDLSGMVDLLSQHLYSGPQVYVRELLQNAVDAVTARRQVDPHSPAKIRLVTFTDAAGRSVLQVTDTGRGLSAAEARDLLSTIGRSSKRGATSELEPAGFIGQFGIGMLAAFMVADRIEVRTRSMAEGASAITWVGHTDGTFEIIEADAARDEIGTTVELVARPDAAHWLSYDTVSTLAVDFGSLLPFDIAIEVPDLGVWRRLTERELPWFVGDPDSTTRAAALVAACEQVFGFTPLASIPLEVAAHGVTGVAFVLPAAVAPAAGRHRVYSKRMLVGPRVDHVLPEWAFFVRAVLNADGLSPTASREQLHDDTALLEVREALGQQLKTWALTHLREGTTLARRILAAHHLALRAAALTDDSLLDLVTDVLFFETTDGVQPLSDALTAGELLFTTTAEAFQRVAAVARAQGIVVVNAGYVYDADLMARLETRRGWRVRELQSSDVLQVLDVVELAREMQVAAAVARAREVLREEDCDLVVRRFAPDSVPAMLLRDAAGERRRERDRERSAQPDRWGGLLDAFSEQSSSASRTLVLNDANAVSRRLLGAVGTEAFEPGLRALYFGAVMLEGEGLRARESAALTAATGALLALALGEEPS